MRYNPYKAGDYRIVSRFALFPITIKDCDTGEEEVRWLEEVVVFQKYGGFNVGWSHLKFLDSKEEIEEVRERYGLIPY